MSEILLLGLVLGISILGLITAYLLAKWVLKKDVGDEAMQKISNAIKEGAESFMRRQFKTIIILAVIVAAVLFIGYGFIRQHRDFDPVGTSLVFAFWIAFSFILGAACSLVAGFIGMWV